MVKCSFCNKKIGLITFSCNCGGVFCVKHQTIHSHNCSLQTKETKEIIKKKIEVNNPKVDHSKIEKI
jgi:AN1-type zinc finger protein 5/6